MPAESIKKASETEREREKRERGSSRKVTVEQAQQANKYTYRFDQKDCSLLQTNLKAALKSRQHFADRQPKQREQAV